MDPFFPFSAFNTCISSSDFDENKTQADKSCIAQAKALLDNLQSLNRDDTKYEAYFTLPHCGLRIGKNVLGSALCPP